MRRGVLVLAIGALVTLPASSQQQSSLTGVPLSGWQQYVPPATKKYPPYVKPRAISSTNDMVWEGMKQTESNYTHWEPANPSLPLVGKGDRPKAISWGISQVAIDYQGKNAGPEKAGYAGMKWDLQRYLYDPSYNEALGHGNFNYYSRLGSGNPCFGMAGYNWGPGNARQWQRGAYSKDGTPFDLSGGGRMAGNYPRWANYIEEGINNARARAAGYGMSAKLEEMVRTTPGCGVPMKDIDPSPPKPNSTDPFGSPGAPQERPAIPVEGHCDPEALQQIIAAIKNKQEDLDKTYEPLFRKIKEDPTGSAPVATSGSPASGTPADPGASGASTASTSPLDTMGSCVAGGFEGIQVNIQYPAMDQIIRGVAKEAINKACGKAREKIAKAKSPLTGTFYLNARLPGAPAAGVSIR